MMPEESSTGLLDDNSPNQTMMVEEGSSTDWKSRFNIPTPKSAIDEYSIMEKMLFILKADSGSLEASGRIYQKIHQEWGTYIRSNHFQE